MTKTAQLKVRFAVKGQGSKTQTLLGPARGRLKPEFTFSNFVTGPSNQLAYSAALQVADAPGAVFNPLYIYSGVGLGKTHLLHAIGHRLQEQGINALYVSAEQFTNEYICAIRSETVKEFGSSYCGADALLVDDIQFIVSKPHTQEGFLRIFNELHISGRQIVVGGDRLSGQMKLDDRIQSRLTGRLVVDIQPPDFETRYAILEQKAQTRDFDIPANVLETLAMSEMPSVRDLEGSLNRVLALAYFTNGRVDTELVEKVRYDVSSRQAPRPGSEA